MSTQSAIPFYSSQSSNQPTIPTYLIQPSIQSTIPLQTVPSTQQSCQHTLPQQTLASAQQPIQQTLPYVQNSNYQHYQSAIQNGQQVFQQPFNLPIQLPQMGLMKFDGDFTKYHSFIEMFSSLFDSLPIGDVSKLQYLTMALDGPARDMIAHLSLIGTNYAIARDVLHEQYGDTKRTRHHLIRKLQDLPAMSNNHSMSQLQELWSNASTIFYQLRNLQADSDNVTTADIISRKLPKRYIKLLYTGTNSERNYSASELLQTVSGYIKSETLVNTISNDNKEPLDRKLTTMSVHQHPRHTHQQLPNKTTNGQTLSPCIFCSSTSHVHRHEECPIFNTAEARIQKAREIGLCFGCLRSGHQRSKCSRPRTCNHCKGNHHTVFCQSHNRNATRNPNQREFGSQQMNSNHRINGALTSGPNTRNFRDSRSQSPSRYSREPIRNSQGFTFGRQIPSKQTRYQNQSSSERIHCPTRRVQFGTTAIAESQDFPIHSTENSTTSMLTLTSMKYTPDAPIAQLNEAEETPQLPSDVPMLFQERELPVSMMSTTVNVENIKGEQIPVNVFFDSGSNKSYITENLRDQLDLPSISKKQLKIATFGSDNLQSIKSKGYLVNFLIKDKKIPIALSSVPSIVNSITTAKINEETVQDLIHNDNAILPRTTTLPDILIGLDFMSRILGETTSKILPNGTTINYTDVGIIVTGTENQSTKEATLDSDQYANKHNYHHYTTSSTTDPHGILHIDPTEEHEALHKLLEKFWSLESCFIFENPKTKDDELTDELFKSTTTRDPDGRYVCKWPFKGDKSTLPDNRQLAYFRLQSTLKRLNKDIELYKKYEEIIKDQERRGFIELVQDEFQPSYQRQYLSHHPVIKPTSTSTKVRIVYDGSARATKTSKSLNAILHTGESLLPNLTGVLLRIRQPSILVSSDLEKAFLQLGLHHEDHDFCRFLWQPWNPGTQRYQLTPQSPKIILHEPSTWNVLSIWIQWNLGNSNNYRLPIKQDSHFFSHLPRLPSAANLQFNFDCRKFQH